MSATLLTHRVVSQAEMENWPLDRASSGEKCWAETTWGTGPLEGEGRLFFNWNTWPCRVVFEVAEDGAVARGHAEWRRSQLSIRMRGLKLLAAATGEVVEDVVLRRYDGEAVEIDFRPAAGPGVYHLYYGANETPDFAPSEEFQRACAQEQAVAGVALCIEARCAADDFDAMEQVAFAGEVDDLLRRCGNPPYLVFPEDRAWPIKLQLEIPARWALDGARSELALRADRHEYRVFQLGIWACGAEIPNLRVHFEPLQGPNGACVPAEALQCLTLESHIKSRYIVKPSGRCPVPRGQVRALWCGIDLPADLPPGEYSGRVLIEPEGLPAQSVALRLTVSDTVVPERGDHDLWRLSRLRWIESDVGLSDEVFPPYQPLQVAGDGTAISTWGHTWRLGTWGLPAGLRVCGNEVLADAVTLSGCMGGKRCRWRQASLEITEAAPGYVTWSGRAIAKGIEVRADGRAEYDGCAVISLTLASRDGREHKVEGLTLTIPWRPEHAILASGMGYRGKRDGDRAWRLIERAAVEARPAVWMGSIAAGMGMATWPPPPPGKDFIPGIGGNVSDAARSSAWEDISRENAITITGEREAVALRMHLGSHRIGGGRPWRLTFALLPTPVKPDDPRHWQFRYMHKGGWFWPGEGDTPQSFLKDNCARLDEAAKVLGVKRLNLHDWWGPAFNYPWQWDGPDNLARLTAEAHKRGIFVKVYNSGRELSSFAPEFWALLYEGTEYRFRDGIDPQPRLYFQDAWRQNHLPDGIPPGWPRLHTDRGNEHCIPVSNATRNGNFYLESMRYMTRFFCTDGAYWDGADGPTLGHREMAKRLWVIFRETNPDAAIDVHHGNDLLHSPVADHMLCFPFIDSLWHGEGFEYDRFDPWTWLVEIAGLPFNVPSELLCGETYLGRGMLFGLWSRHGWGHETEIPRKLWAFFDRFGMAEAEMLGWWLPENGVTVDRPDTLVTAYRHPKNGVLLAIATWQQPLAGWMEMTFDVSLVLNRKVLGLGDGPLTASDIFTGEELDITRPVPMPDVRFGRLIWVR